MLFRSVLPITIVCSVLLSAGIANESDARPNISLILCDDLGYADMGFNVDLFGVESDAVTSNLDRLAKHGTLCSQAYVSRPFCDPSRMASLSGRMPHTYGGQKNRLVHGIGGAIANDWKRLPMQNVGI